jgi:hypothetical protein
MAAIASFLFDLRSSSLGPSRCNVQNAMLHLVLLSWSLYIHAIYTLKLLLQFPSQYASRLRMAR